MSTGTALDQIVANGNIPPNRLKYRLLLARLEAGLKQQELADIMEVSRTIVSDAEQGVRPPRRLILKVWAMATGVPLGWLEHGDGGWMPPENRPDECPHQGSNLGPAD